MLMKDPAVCLEVCKNIKGILTLGLERDEGQLVFVTAGSSHTLERASILQWGGAGMSDCFLQPQVGSCALQGVPRVADALRRPSESVNRGEMVSYRWTWRQMGAA